MKKTIKKILLIVLALLVAVPLLFYAKAHFSTQSRVNKIYEIEPYAIPIPNDSATLALGAHLAITKGCTDCHGENLAGKVFIDDAKLVFLPSANLTTGKGGLPADYSIEDWVRALRHGINREGKSLFIMPSYEYMSLTEKDLAAIIAYCQHLPPIDNVLPDKKLGPLGKILTELNQVPLLSAEMVDHEKPMLADIEIEVSATYGEYLSISCIGCHRANLKGGGPLAPGFPPVPDITSTSRVASWDEEQFFKLLRTGVNPDGKHVSNQDMPWEMTKHYSDVDIKALFKYLKSI